MQLFTVISALLVAAASAQDTITTCDQDLCVGKGGLCIVTPVTKVPTCVELRVCAPGLGCKEDESCFPTPNCVDLGCIGICIPN